MKLKAVKTETILNKGSQKPLEVDLKLGETGSLDVLVGTISYRPQSAGPAVTLFPHFLLKVDPARVKDVEELVINGKTVSSPEVRLSSGDVIAIKHKKKKENLVQTKFNIGIEGH